MIGETKAQVTSGVLKVSAHSNPNSVAGALAAVIRQRESAELQAVGAGAVNQAVKAVAIARTYLQSAGIDIVVVPAFIELQINGNSRTGIALAAERRKN